MQHARGEPRDSASSRPCALYSVTSTRQDGSAAAGTRIPYRTGVKEHPGTSIPADNKWFTRMVVAAAVMEALDSLDLCYPKVDKKQRKELATARTALG